MRRGWIVWAGIIALSGSSPLLGAEGQIPTTLESASREVRRGILRNSAGVTALIERLDAAVASGDVLPVHAVELSLRKAVELELSGGRQDLTRERALRLQDAERVGGATDATHRGEAYRTTLTSWVDPRDAPPPGPRKVGASSKAAPDEADLERRLRGAVHDLSQLDGALDGPGVSARRHLLLELLAVARVREQVGQARLTEPDDPAASPELPERP